MLAAAIIAFVLHGGAYAGVTAGRPKLTWNDLCPYLVANEWPHAVLPDPEDAESFVHVAPADEGGADASRVQYHMARAAPGRCISNYEKGQGLIARPDEALLELACTVAASTPEVTTSMPGWWRDLMSSKRFETTRGVAAWLLYLREGMSSRCTKAPELKRAVCGRFPMLVTDC